MHKTDLYTSIFTEGNCESQLASRFPSSLPPTTLLSKSSGAFLCVMCEKGPLSFVLLMVFCLPVFWLQERSLWEMRRSSSSHLHQEGVSTDLGLCLCVMGLSGNMPWHLRPEPGVVKAAHQEAVSSFSIKAATQSCAHICTYLRMHSLSLPALLSQDLKMFTDVRSFTFW